MTRSLCALALAALLPLSATAGRKDAAPAAAPAPDMTVTPVADRVWAPLDPTNPGGLQVSLLSGDMQKGPTSFFLRLPAGSKSPGHTHTYYGVVVQGAPGHGLTADAATQGLPVGSTWVQPGGQAHYDACNSAEPCVLLLVYPTGGFDFQMAE